MDSNSRSPVSGETPERPVNRAFAETAVGSSTAAHWSGQRRYLATQHGIVGAVQRNRQPAADQPLAVYLVAAGGENIGEFGDVTVILRHLRGRAVSAPCMVGDAKHRSNCHGPIGGRFLQNLEW